MTRTHETQAMSWLDATPASLARTAARWRDLARAAAEAGTDVGTAARDLLEAWESTAGDAYRVHQDQLVDAYLAIGAAAGRVARSVDAAAEVLRATQSHLDDVAQRLGPCPAAAVEAQQILTHADQRLAAIAGELAAIPSTLRAHELIAQAKEGPYAPWLTGTQPALPLDVIVDGGDVIINATGESDHIGVGLDAVTGQQVVAINGVVRRFPADAALTVRAGAGDDTITVTAGSPVRVTLLGGTGHDRILGGTGDEVMLGLWGQDTLLGGVGSDRISGGADSDYLDGQAGDDAVFGGSGYDTLYGLGGRDWLQGGSGGDYLDGGSDPDRLVGGSGSDVLVGGRGTDTVVGGAPGGDPVPSAGGGRGAGTDRAFGEPGDTTIGVGRQVTVELTDIAGFIQIEGSPEFVVRVQSDLDALRASERGAAMLAALQAAHEDSRAVAADWPIVGGLANQGHTLTIRETTAANGYADWSAPIIGPIDARIDYNPTFDDLDQRLPTPPIVVLYHELAHIYDGFHGTDANGVHQGPDNRGVPNLEREAVGLPIDHDADPSTPDALHPDHPFAYTENGLREELGLPPRPRY
jgi:hypothetical protein